MRKHALYIVFALIATLTHAQYHDLLHISPGLAKKSHLKQVTATARSMENDEVVSEQQVFAMAFDPEGRIKGRLGITDESSMHLDKELYLIDSVFHYSPESKLQVIEISEVVVGKPGMQMFQKRVIRYDRAQHKEMHLLYYGYASDSFDQPSEQFNYYYDKKGRLIKEEMFNMGYYSNKPELSYSNVYEYNKQKKVTKVVENSYSYTSTSLYYYNKKGNLTLAQTFYEDEKKPAYEQIVEYLGDKQIVRTFRYGNLVENTKTIYSVNGEKITEEQEKNQEDNIKETIRTEYDKGHPTFVYITKEEKEVLLYEYRYNDQQFLHERVQFDEEGKIVQIVELSYRFYHTDRQALKK